MTASVGAAVCLPQRTRQTAADFLAEADRAMYAAKAAGKNSAHFLSLVGDEDDTFLEEVRLRLFSTFLFTREVTTPQQVRAALQSSPLSPVLVGRLARRLGWVKPRQLRRLLRDRRQNRRTFAESALARALA